MNNEYANHSQLARLCGYPDQWSAESGDRVPIRCSGPPGRATVDVVDLVAPDPHRAVTAAVPAELAAQPLPAGSYVEATGLRLPLSGSLSFWVRPHQCGERQSLLSMIAGNWMLQLDLDGDRPELRAGSHGTWHAGNVLTDRDWTLLIISWTPAAVRLIQTSPDAGSSSAATLVPVSAEPPSEEMTLRLGTGPVGASTPSYSGRIALPALASQDVDEARRAALLSSTTAAEITRTLARDAVAVWDVAADPGSPVMPDIHNGCHARLFNRPLTGIIGPGGLDDGPTALQTSSEDLDDAGWPVTATITVPDGDSSVLGIRVRAADDQTMVLPLVRLPGGPADQQPAGTGAVVLPTYTYLAYANHRQRSEAQYITDYSWVTAERIVLSDTDAYLNEHPELGPSLYDRRADGCAAHYSSRLRPVLNVAPGYRWWMTGAPRHFSADLLLLRWLRSQHIPTHVYTDAELQARGHSMLANYRVVLTGSHPEYITSEQRAAVSAYVARGGRLMYLGGNGFYWVTGVDPRYPHAIEVRRSSVDGWWDNEPGELTLTSTGELGGLWRDHGRTPQQLLGIGMAAQGWGPAPAYRRLPDSYRPEAAWVFSGIASREIGAHGLALGGAAGDEIDRADPELGTPPDTLILATSAGGHSQHYQPAPEDSGSRTTVRADLTLRWIAGGGAVFSVGSINWITSLTDDTDGDDNDVARITRNVLDRFREPDPPRPDSHTTTSDNDLEASR